MTQITFHSEGSRLTGVEIKGHSGYAPEGEDIVCAAISSAIGLCECAINDVLGLQASVKVQQDEPLIALKLPNGLSQGNESTAQTLLAALMVHLVQLAEEYPDYISVLEV